jgi:hypothetical protein
MTGPAERTSATAAALRADLSEQCDQARGTRRCPKTSASGDLRRLNEPTSGRRMNQRLRAQSGSRGLERGGVAGTWSRVRSRAGGSVALDRALTGAHDRLLARRPSTSRTVGILRRCGASRRRPADRWRSAMWASASWEMSSGWWDMSISSVHCGRAPTTLRRRQRAQNVRRDEPAPSEGTTCSSPL